MRYLMATLLLMTPTAALAIESGTATVDATGAATLSHGSANFFLDSGSVPGEYPIRIGTSAADDAAGGVLFSSVAETGRIDAARVGGTQLQFAVGGTVADADPTSINTRNLAGGLSVTTTKVGAAGVPGTPPTAAPNGGEPFGADFGAAYFPLSEGWITGTFSSSTVNTPGATYSSTYGALDTYTGSAGVTLDENYYGAGQHRLNIPGVSDPWAQGMVWVSTAANVGRYATAQPHPDGTGYWISTPDNDGFFEFDPSSDPDLVNESDSATTPFSFLFLPTGQTGVTAAYTNPSYTSSANFVEAYAYSSVGSDFQMVPVDRVNNPGQYRLTVAGGSPSQGTLLLNNAFISIAGDNALTYEPDGDGWIITTEDIESNLLTGDTETLSELDGLGQNHDLNRPYFSFMYVPNEGAATQAAATPTLDSVTHLDRSKVFAWNSRVIASNNDNAPGDVLIEIQGETPGAQVAAVGNQKGDHTYAAYGRALNRYDGVMLATLSEGFRDNSAVGGFSEYGVIGTTQFSGGYWSAVTSTARGYDQGEHNINHAVAFFGADSGFRMEAARDITGVTGVDYAAESEIVSFSDVDSRTDGVLIATPYGNDDNYLIAEPQADGAGWRVTAFDNGVDVTETSTEPDAFSYVYLPYDTENLIAGMVSEDGTLLSSSEGAGTEWTLTKELDAFSFPQYRLSITGKTADDGILLLTSTGGSERDAEGNIISKSENFDNSVLYEVDDATGDFLIRGLDHVAGSPDLVDYQEASFMFAYIDYAASLVAPGLTGDYNDDGVVDAADYTVWRDNQGTGNALPNDPVGGAIGQDQYDNWVANFGKSLGGPAPSAAVPEPSALLTLAAASCLFASRRSRRGC